MGLTKYEVTFDNNLLTQVTGLSILGVNLNTPPSRTLGNFLLARSDKRKINSAFYTERHIMVDCVLTRDTRASLDTQVDVLNNLIQGVEKTLVVPQDSWTRQFTSTLNEFVINESSGGYMSFTLDFICSDSYGYDLAYTSLLQVSGRTLYNYTDSFTVGGSAYWQVPIIKITFTALTGGSNASVVVKNPATGQATTVSRTWAAGDILTIDSQNKTVQVNAADVDFTGAIPEWRTGTGYIQVYDQFLTRTKTEFVYYFKRWV